MYRRALLSHHRLCCAALPFLSNCNNRLISRRRTNRPSRRQNRCPSRRPISPRTSHGYFFSVFFILLLQPTKTHHVSACCLQSPHSRLAAQSNGQECVRFFDFYFHASFFVVRKNFSSIAHEYRQACPVGRRAAGQQQCVNGFERASSHRTRLAPQR